MSLIVARLIPSGPRIASDSLIIDPDEARDRTRGGLKAVVVNRELCVCFAGRVAAGLAVVREVKKLADSGQGLAAIISSIEDRQITEADFLICSLNPRGIVRIADGVTQNLSVGWIGDQEAFEAFQQAFHDAPETFGDEPSEEWDMSGRIDHAMRSVIDSAHVQTVGGVLVRVGAWEPNDQFAFNYRWELSAVAGHVAQVLREGWNDVAMGGAPEGAFRFHVMAPDEPGIGAIATHYSPGEVGIGLLFHPLKLDDPVKYERVTKRELGERIREDFGLALGRYG